MRYIIDRFEDKFAVCEDEVGDMHNLLKEKLPANVKEGDILVEDENGELYVNEEETQKRKKYIDDFFNSL